MQMSCYLSWDTQILPRKSGGTDCACVSSPATLDVPTMTLFQILPSLLNLAEKEKFPEKKT